MHLVGEIGVPADDVGDVLQFAANVKVEYLQGGGLSGVVT